MNLRWAKEWVGALDGKHLDRQMAWYRDDTEYEDVIFGVTRIGQEKIREFVAAFHEDRGEHKFEVTGYFGGPGGGAVEWTWTANLAGDFLGLPAAGRQAHIRGVSVVAFDNEGKLTLNHDYWNPIPVFRQLGLIT